MENEKEDRIKRILEGDTEGLYPEEERIVKKAMPFNQRRQNLKRFMFTDTDTLIENITQIYPAAISITIVNNDERDKDNTPRLTAHTIGKASFTVHKTRGYQGRLQFEEVRGISGCWQTVLCLVENGFVTVKKSNITFGET